MTKDQVLKEFKDFNLSETEIVKIVSFYRAGADVLGVIIGPRILSEEIQLKLALNSIKHTIVLMLELRDEKRKNQVTNS